MNVRLKTPGEIDALEEVGAAATEVLALLLHEVKPGVTGKQIDAYADVLIAERGYKPTFKDVPGYEWATCINLNDIIAHGVPTTEPFQEGDLIGIDVALTSKDGLVTDTAWSVLLGDSSEEAKSLMDGGQLALRLALEECVVGKTTGDIGAVIGEVSTARGFGCIQYLSGHGTGYEMHEDPPVPNFGERGKGYPLVDGLVIAIEPMLTTGSGEIALLEDGWSVVTADANLSSLFEMSVAITSSGLRILTPPPRPFAA
jgi:methionyl aminopeptidase